MTVHRREENSQVVGTLNIHEHLRALDVDGLMSELETIEAELQMVEAGLREHQYARQRLLEQRIVANGLLATKRSLAALEHERESGNDEATQARFNQAGGHDLFDRGRPRSAADAVRTVLRTFPRDEWRAEEVLEAIGNLEGKDRYRLHSIQVALGRLLSSGEVQRPRRGVYRLAPTRSGATPVHIPDLVEGLLEQVGVHEAPVPLDVLLHHFNVELEPRKHQLEDAVLVPPSASGAESSSAFAIYYNPSKPEVRRRSAIAHELGHLALREAQGLAGAPLRNPRGDERQANRFAAELLTPQLFVRAAVAELGSDIEALAKRFGVSAAAMTMRLEELGLVPASS